MAKSKPSGDTECMGNRAERDHRKKLSSLNTHIHTYVYIDERKEEKRERSLSSTTSDFSPKPILSPFTMHLL